MKRAWLIGAGPGDVELMTLKATRALAQADVILVDDLVNPEDETFGPGSQAPYLATQRLLAARRA